MIISTGFAGPSLGRRKLNATAARKVIKYHPALDDM